MSAENKKMDGNREDGRTLEVCPHCGGSLRMAERGLYTLRRRKRLWQVVFDGQAGQFKHEKGAEYVARLLVERGPIHALELAAKAGGRLASPEGQAGRTRKRRAEASLREVMEFGGRVQERSPALDDSEARQRLLDSTRLGVSVSRALL